MISKSKILLSFDSIQLQRDLALIKPEDWVLHFNTGYYEGEWSGVALRSMGGVSTQLYSEPNPTGEVEDTKILRRCANLRRALLTFQCPVRSARLLKLAAGAQIREHRDLNLALEDGEIRLHIPIVTNPEVEFFLDAEKVEMKEGECWYLNFNLPHWVRNNGKTDRIHLVVDCVLDDWLKQLLPVSGIEPAGGESNLNIGRESGPQEFERFCKFVLSEPDIQQRLRQTNDRSSFARLAVRIGEEHDYRFNPKDVEDALHAARRAWYERWNE